MMTAFAPRHLATEGALGQEPSAPRSQLVLELKGAEGQPLLTSRCELLLRDWGETARLELPTEKNILTVPLDESWIADQWMPVSRSVTGRISIRAPGHAPLVSDDFQWIPAPGSISRSPEASSIRFPRGLAFEVRRGKIETGVLDLRHREPRALELVDERGQPLADVAVALHLHWSHENHCGVLSGHEKLGQGISDHNGLVAVPDGEFEYAFIFTRQGWWLADPQERYAPMRWIGRLEEGTTTVRLRRKKTVTLDLTVTRGGQPAGDVLLMGRLAHSPCEAASGSLESTDREGRIRIPSFWAEGHDRIWLEDRDGRTLWEADPCKLELSVRLELKLP